jgi:transketolase
MGAALNGMTVCNVRAFGGTFFNFLDYMKPSVRLAAIMEIPVIYIYTHDSIGLGEDGPTHQPIEQLATLRATPGIVLLRPGDANEVVEAWKIIMQLNREPAALVLSRQAMPTFDRTKYASAAGVAKGAYVLADAADGKPEVILIGTGSEVSLCVGAYEQLTKEGIKARVVSMPSWDLFEKQGEAYQNEVLPPAVGARVAVEQASTFGWPRWVGPTGNIVAMRTFGASAPIKDLQKKYGFTVENVIAAARETMKRQPKK